MPRKKTEGPLGGMEDQREKEEAYSVLQLSFTLVRPYERSSRGGPTLPALSVPPRKTKPHSAKSQRAGRPLPTPRPSVGPDRLTQAACRTCSRRRLEGMRKSRRQQSPSPWYLASRTRNSWLRTVGAVASKGGNSPESVFCTAASRDCGSC